MSCCGSNRRPSRQEAQAPDSGGQRQWTSGPVEFEYVGTGQLSVTGPLTGVVYHFSPQAPRVRVHGPDAPSLLSVPGLRPVR